MLLKVVDKMFNIYNPFSDFINRILTAQKSGFNYVFLGFSKFFISVLKALKINGYIDSFFIFFFNFNLIIVKLKYYNGYPLIKVFRRISKTGLKVYKGYKSLPIFPKRMGCIFVSTVKGVFNSNFCKQNGLGGEIICHVF
ncbi:MAG: 30S ribosomal protein S8 [Candidatus Nasuia deltocephalinicola]